MAILHTHNNEDHIALQKWLRTLKSGSMIPAAHRPMPPLRWLRFVPPSTEILRSRLFGDEESTTDGDASVSGSFLPFPFPFGPH